MSEWHKDENVLKNGSLVPDSCCKTPTLLCGRRDHPSNIHYTVSIDSQPANIFANIIITLLDLKSSYNEIDPQYMNKVSIRSIVSGLYLQVSRDDQGSLDHPRGCWPGIVGPRAVRHRARLVPLHKAEA